MLRLAAPRELLEQAVGIYEQLDAARDLARAEGMLREMGIRRGRRGTRSRPQIGWAGGRRRVPRSCGRQ